MQLNSPFLVVLSIIAGGLQPPESRTNFADLFLSSVRPFMFAYLAIKIGANLVSV